MTGVVAEHAFAGRDADAERALTSALASWGSDDVARRGEAYLVGAGPGGIDLITIRGRQLLATADVVLYDRLVSAELLQYARRDAELICVGKTPRRPSISQKQLNRLLVSLVQSGKRVCRLKGGDPFVFGRGGEELEALAEAGLKFQVVPGVSAAEGCAAYAGIPLTLRGVAHAVLLTTGHTRDDGTPATAEFRPGQTLALYMGVAQYAEIADALIANGYAARRPSPSSRAALPIGSVSCARRSASSQPRRPSSRFVRPPCSSSAKPRGTQSGIAGSRRARSNTSPASRRTKTLV